MNAMNAYAQSKFRTFAEGFHATLPPELRQLVYAYICDRERHFKDLIRGFTCQRHARTVRLPDHKLPCFIRPEYVGDGVAAEVTSVIYKDIFSHWRSKVPAEHLDEFLFADATGNGVVPLHSLKQLEVEWDYDYHTEHVIANLNILAKTSFTVPITLKIFLDCWHLVPIPQLPMVLADELEAFRPVHGALLEEGHVVKFWEIILKSDLTDFYDMPMEEWIFKMEAELEERPEKRAMSLRKNTAVGRHT
jgi:hypothetical protein